MADYSHRKSTLRQAFKSNLISKQKLAGKLRGRYLFRAAVRRVMEYIDWIGNDSSGVIGDDVTANVKLAKRKKLSESDLSVKDRSILLIMPDKRSEEDVEHIQYLIEKRNAFKKYPGDIKTALAADCGYQYLPAGRTIIRQGHKASFLYYIYQGELDILRDVVDNLTGEVHRANVGSLKTGDMFGEIALLHKVPRTATVISKSPVDLLIVSRHEFNDHLRNYLMEEWDVLRDAFLNFNYFKGWNEEIMRECCILSKIANYAPNEVSEEEKVIFLIHNNVTEDCAGLEERAILLGDGKGMVHYVYFLLSGECKLIEHILIEKEINNKKVKYKMYDGEKKDKNPRQRLGRNKKLELDPDDDLQSFMLKSISQTKSKDKIRTVEEQASATDEFIKLISSKKDNVKVAMGRISVITITLQDVINQWHEITDAVEMLMKQPSVTSLNQYPKNVQTVFMQICIFYRGACFGLGEQMKNRRVVSITPVKCLLIPRFWLTHHNRANIWERVKIFLNSKYPCNKQLLHKYISNKTWTKHKKKYVQSLVKQGRNLPNNTKNYDVPYSIRINESNISD